MQQGRDWVLNHFGMVRLKVRPGSIIVEGAAPNFTNYTNAPRIIRDPFVQFVEFVAAPLTRIAESGSDPVRPPIDYFFSGTSVTFT